LQLRARPGQALVEFALLLPILMLLLLGIIEFGRAWDLKQLLDDSSREAARRAAVATTAPLDSVRLVVKARLANESFDSTVVTVNVTNLNGPTGSIVTVESTYPYRLGWIAGILQWTTGQANITIHGRADFRNE
jgi:Flp pilus assembly protein TadG